VGLDLSHEEVPERLLKRWAIDCLGWIVTEEQLAHRITILQIQNTRAKLPDDFKYLAQVAAHPWYEPEECDCKLYPDHDCCNKPYPKDYHHHYPDFPYDYPKSRREDIVQWTQGAFEKDCELEINLICPSCKQINCSCNSRRLR